MPYAEPTYLSKGFHSPYYTEVRAAAAAGRDLVCRRMDSDLFFLMVGGAHRLGTELVVGCGHFFCEIEPQGVPEGRQEVLR